MEHIQQISQFLSIFLMEGNGIYVAGGGGGEELAKYRIGAASRCGRSLVGFYFSHVIRVFLSFLFSLNSSRISQAQLYAIERFPVGPTHNDYDG